MQANLLQEQNDYMDFLIVMHMKTYLQYLTSLYTCFKRILLFTGPSTLIEVNMQVRSMGPISEMDMVSINLHIF